MNKKVLALAICIPLALIIIAGIVASSIILSQRKIHPTSVKITNVEFINTARTALFDVTDGEKTFQLTWEVLPADAEDKGVTFSSNNTDFKMSAGGLVTFSKAFDGATVIIKTNDGAFTDAVTFVTKSSAAQTVGYDFATNMISEPSNGSNYALDMGELVLFQGTKYFFGDFIIADKDNTGNIAINNAVITPNRVGEYTLSIMQGTTVKSLEMKVVQQINTIALPIELAASEKKSIIVGNQNNYNFNVVASGINGAIDYDELAVTYAVQQKTNDSYGTPRIAVQNGNVHTVEGVVSITDGNIVKFHSGIAGKTYKLTVSFR